MNRQAQGVILLLFGFAVLRVSVTDLYLRYVKEGLRPFLIAAGLVLFAAGIMTLRYDRRASRAADDEHGADDGHGHAHREPRVTWLLLLPVLCLTVVAPPALGSYAAGQAGTVLSAPAATRYRPLPPGDPLPMSLMNYAGRAVFDDGRTLTGRTVRLTGFVTPSPDGRPMLARMVMSCCAADGRPVKVGLDGAVPAGIAEDTWIQAEGAYTPRRGTDPINRAAIPYLAVTSWQEITPPMRQYE